MLGTTDLSTYLAGLALIVLLPGPNSLYVLSVAARRGPRTAYRAAAGVHPDYAHPALSFLFLGAWAQLFSITYLTVLIFSGSYLAAAFRRRHRLAAGLSAGAGALFLGFAAKLSLASAGS